MRIFEEVWSLVGGTATHKAKKEFQKGWNDCIRDGLCQKLRGIDWYCRGWNACMDEKEK